MMHTSRNLPCGRALLAKLSPSPELCESDRRYIWWNVAASAAVMTVVVVIAGAFHVLGRVLLIIPCSLQDSGYRLDKLTTLAVLVTFLVLFAVR